MQANETDLKSLIEGVKQYLIPLFQRSYSWEKKEWKRLWDDLIELYEQPNPHDHFMGSIVTMPTKSIPEGVSKFVVIDGQQRLTTFFIILALIRDLSQNHDKQISDEINETYLINKFKKDNDFFKLLPTQTDRYQFSLIIKPDIGTKDYEQNVIKAYKFFENRLKGYDNLDFKKLIDIIIGKLNLVSVVLDPNDNPHRIFESLNAKGRPLTQADLIRNYCFMKIKTVDQEKIYLDYWKPMQDDLGDNMTEFFRHYLMSDGSEVNKDEIYYTLTQRIENNQYDIIDYLKKLRIFSQYYKKLLEPTNENDQNIFTKLIRLNRIQVTTAYPFLLNVYDDYENQKIDSFQFKEILEIIENFIIRRYICRIPTNTLNKIFPVLYKQIKSKILTNIPDELKTILATKEYPIDKDFHEALVGRNIYGHGDTDKIKLILETLELSYKHQEPVDFSKLSIEHIMPQTLNEWWRNHIDDSEVIHEIYLHTIGNLTLTGYNSDMSNYDFPTKKEILIQSHLELNRYFQLITKWDEDEIKNRGEQIAKMAIQIWPYFGSDNRNYNYPTKVIEPKKLTFMKKEYYVSSWRDVMEKILEAIYDYDSDFFKIISERFPHYLGRNVTEFRSYRPISGGYYFETNLSSNRIFNFCVEATQLIGISYNEWKIE